jgi:hypothetical protein
MPCAREGQSPIGTCVRDQSPKGRDRSALAGSVHESPPLARRDSGTLFGIVPFAGFYSMSKEAADRVLNRLKIEGRPGW